MTTPQPVNRNAIRCSEKGEDSHITFCLEQESFVMDMVRQQCRWSNARTSPGSEHVTTEIFKPSRRCKTPYRGACGNRSSGCLITVRRKGVKQQGELSQPITVLLPRFPAELAAIGACIWAAFETVKERNKSERDLAIMTGQGKRLREVAPIPWLRWTANDGRSGQFRKKENFEMWWSSNVVANGEKPGTGIAWLAIKL